MVFVLVTLVVAVLAGLLRGGRLDRLGLLPLRHRNLVVIALTCQLLGAVLGHRAYPVGLAVSALLVAAFLASNHGVRGTGLVAAGLVANALVVGLNGAMPVSREAAARAGVSTRTIDDGQDDRREIAGTGTRVRSLGDVVPVLLPWVPEVLSAGDVLVAAGLAELVVIAMGRRRRPVRPWTQPSTGGHMAKKGRKRRARKKSAANHGKRPNA